MNKLSAIPKLLKNNWIELLFSFIFALIFTTGFLLESYDDIDVRQIGLRMGIACVFGAIVLWGLFFCGFAWLRKKLLANKRRGAGRTLFRKISTRKLWVIVSLVIFACYLPIILSCFSVLTPDSWSSIGQVTGEVPLSNAHPVIFTGFLSIFLNVGLFFGSFEFGVVLFSLAQSALLAMIFAKIIVWMRDEKVSKYGIFATFVFYALLPINAIAGIIMWKDILFAGFGLMLIVLSRQLYLERGRFLNKKTCWFFVMIAFLFIVWRNNGLYVYLLFAFLFVILGRKTLTNRFSLLLLSAPLVFYVLYSLAISSLAAPTTMAEMLSVPVQQIARTIKYHGQSISADDKAVVGEILPVDTLGEIYDPELSDPVKSAFDEEAFNESRGKYVGLWINLGLNYSKTYLASFLYNTFGYVYPFYADSKSRTDILLDNAMHFNAMDGYVDSAFASGAKQLVGKYRDTINSIMPLLQNIGFYFCVILIALYAAIVNRRKELLGAFLVLLGVFLTTILGPVNAEFRYLYLFVLAAPFVLCVALRAKNAR